jgi:uncharacterized membrane protein
MMGALDDESRAAVLARLSQRAYPSIEFFIFAFSAGLLLGLAYLIDSPAVLLIGVLAAPLLTPWVGALLGGLTGEFGFSLRTLGALLIACLLVFVTSLFAGLIALILKPLPLDVRPFLPLPLSMVVNHTRLWWPDLAVVVFGSVLLSISFVRSEERPVLPSVMVAYGIFVPLSAAAFGLAGSVNDTWLQGLLVFAIHLALASTVGAVTLFFMGFRTRGPLAFISLAATILIGAAVIFGLGSVEIPQQPAPVPGVTVTATSPGQEPQASPTAAVSTALPSNTVPAAAPPPTSTITLTATTTPTVFIEPSATPTVTITAAATPVYARIQTQNFGGTIIRSSPGGPALGSLANGMLVQVLPETETVGRTIYVHVIATLPDGRVLDGWVPQSVLVTATPAPNW